MTDEPEVVETPTEPPAAVEYERGDDGKFVAKAEPVAEPEAEAVAEPETGEEQPDPAEETHEDDDLHDGKRRDRSAKARINERTRQLREAERERDFYKGLVSQSTPLPPTEGATKPVLDDFDSYDAFNEALVDWKVAETLSKSTAQTAERTENMVREANWAAKMDEARDKLPDYAEVVGASEIDVTNIREALLESDHGPELAYHLAKNPEVAKRLNGLSPVKAALELGKLETALSAPVVKPASKAPAPITPISTGPTTRVNLNTASMEDYMVERARMGARFRV